MKSFRLVECTTRDKLIHQGIFFKPKSSTKRALLWVHGLTDTFYGDAKLHTVFAEICEEFGFGYAVFNNRGHDLLASSRKVDKREPKGYTHINVGSGFEKFADCVYDIEAGVNFLVANGFTEVVVIGHSTGANKACYYAATKPHRHLFGIVLAGPLSDRLDSTIEAKKLKQNLKRMHELIDVGRGDELFSGYHFFPLTPKRFISLFEANSLEDQFDYGDPQPQMKYFSKIKKPLLVIIGEKDEYLDRQAQKMLGVFDAHQHSTNYKSIIVKNAFHSFNGQETELVKTIISWSINLI